MNICAACGEEVTWISVEEKLPEVGIYQVYVDPSFSHGFQAVATFSMGKFEVDGHDYSNAADLITHWAPLRSPPKDQS